MPVTDPTALLGAVGALAPDDVYVTPVWVSIAATAVGAVEGALLALDEGDPHDAPAGVRVPGMDLVGMMVIAACLGFGGGVVRDVLCGTLPPEALQDPWLLITVVTATVGVWVLHQAVRRLGALIFLLDALVLGLFGVIGAQKALQVGLPTLTAVLLGAVVSVAGGLLADVLLNRRPALLLAGPPYALASLAGVVLYVVAVRELDADPTVAAAAAVAVVVALRVLADRLGIRVPEAVALRGTAAARVRALVADRSVTRAWRGRRRTDDSPG